MMPDKVSNTPWITRPAWASRVIRPRHRYGVALLMAIVWNFLIWPFVFFLMIPELRQGNTWMLLFGVFPMIALGLGLWAIREVRNFLRFRKCELHLETFPGVIGGPFRAELLLAGELYALHDLSIRLVCEEYNTAGEGIETNVRVALELPKVAESIRRSRDGQPVPIDFQIPYGAPPSGVQDKDRSVCWKLIVRGESDPKPNLEFEVPVFETEDSDPALTEVSGWFDPADEHAGQVPLAKMMRVHRDPVTGTEITVSRWPGWVPMTVFIAIILALVICAVVMGFQGATVFPATGAIAFTLGLVHFLGGSRLVISPETVLVQLRRIRWGRTQRIPRGEIANVEVRNAQGIFVFGDATVDLVLSDGQRVFIGSCFSCEAQARVYAVHVRHELGIGL